MSEKKMKKESKTWQCSEAILLSQMEKMLLTLCVWHPVMHMGFPTAKNCGPKICVRLKLGTSSKPRGTRVKTYHLGCVSESKRRLNVSKSLLMTQQIWLVTSS